MYNETYITIHSAAYYDCSNTLISGTLNVSDHDSVVIDYICNGEVKKITVPYAKITFNNVILKHGMIISFGYDTTSEVYSITVEDYDGECLMVKTDRPDVMFPLHDGVQIASKNHILEIIKQLFCGLYKE